MQENLVAFQHPVTQQWHIKVDRTIRPGSCPKELKGAFTSEKAALAAIAVYRQKQLSIAQAKHIGRCKKELLWRKPLWWKQARAVPDCASRLVFDALVMRFKREHPDFIFPDKFP